MNILKRKNTRIMYDKIVAFSLACIALLSGCSSDNEKYLLRINFLPGDYTIDISSKTHKKDDGTIRYVLSEEECWDIDVSASEYPKKASLELKRKVFSVQKKDAIDIFYDSDRPYEAMTRPSSPSIGPKPGTKLEAQILNNSQEIGNIRITKQGDPNDSFPNERFCFNEFAVINNIHTLLLEKKVKVGDSWKRPVIRPLTSLGNISKPADAVVAIVTFEKIEKIDETEFAVLKVTIDTKKDKLTFHGGDVLYWTHKDVILTSEGRILLNISTGVPLSYSFKAEMSSTFFLSESKNEVHEEYKCELIQRNPSPVTDRKAEKENSESETQEESDKIKMIGQ